MKAHPCQTPKKAKPGDTWTCPDCEQEWWPFWRVAEIGPSSHTPPQLMWTRAIEQEKP